MLLDVILLKIILVQIYNLLHVYHNIKNNILKIGKKLSKRMLLIFYKH